jgi:cyclic pyranopterin phosphate synthase
MARRITDRFGRTFDYLRIAVTERCNLRCVYCMPEEGVAFPDASQLLTAEEILRVVRVAAGLGVTKLRYTGGEPLVRKDLVAIIASTHAIAGVESIHMTTNGVLFADAADALRTAGLTGVNFSLDSMRPDRFLQITRRTGAEHVLASIRQAGALGFPSVKINVVAMRGFNDDEIPAFAALTRELPVTGRFIELMPFVEHQVWMRGRFFGVERIIVALHAAAPTLAPSAGSSTEEHVFQIPGHAGRLAVIPAFTRSLCGTCDRIRLTADGQIRNCLYSDREFDLRVALRTGADDDALADLLCHAMAQKLVDGWAAQHEAESDGRQRTSMTQIGG